MAECSGTVTKKVSARQAMCTHQQLQDKKRHPNIPASLERLKHIHELWLVWLSD